ncbi:putative acyl transferase acyl hydrolase lysophospholipase [Rosellinia necatrix]|uniref:Putative acyl transferase acyl hydrolase lysophospholipase n=1 Tax=Rosellinia necatrix TaxID=77044 RepID=A0A1W2TFP0_ROSNE|nr:putative acyl transferase acyl hydrolase lysophospholipase [Rosellinia necatrix]
MDAHISTRVPPRERWNGNGSHNASTHNDFGVNGTSERVASPKDGPKTQGQQTPIAVVGMACRLPGHCKSPNDLWDFMMRGGIASNETPKTRFNLSGHFDSSRKPYTMKTPGGMFMEEVDPQDFDAQFFNINYSEACSMDPQQRNLLEVAYECLENAGVPIESLSGQRVGCLVGASAVDYLDIASRDPEDRTDSPTMGAGRALLSNRISHFLNVHGPSMAIDTACSSTLSALDMACLYLGNNQADAMLVGGANMYLSPERNQDMGAMRSTASSSGRCHAFDSKADGYVEAEAINVVFLKRLDDAIRDGDPIRAVIRGTSTNSAGKTAGIAMPNPTAQASAIRAAYANAGIAGEFQDTGYLECHGTGTAAGDPAEVAGVAMVFAPTRPANQPLAIGSIKSNIGHSEAAAGLSSLIKAILAIEKGVLPGTATFITPNPKIDFEKSRVKVFRNSIKWPYNLKRRASINSFGFGGANAHAVIESPEYLSPGFTPKHKSSYLDSGSIDADFFMSSADDVPSNSPPRLLVLSANDHGSLKRMMRGLSSQLLSPSTSVTLDDLAYTLSERRSRLYYRAFSVQKTTDFPAESFTTGKVFRQGVRIGFVFTGQGAQWPAMGRDLLSTFPTAKKIVKGLDEVLAGLPEPPSWSLVSALTDKYDPSVLREPEFSQPIVTALQLAYLGVLSDWGIKPTAVVGHSSGEIAAAVVAGRLTPDEAIKVAFFRGQAAKALPPAEKLGMLAIGLGVAALEELTTDRDIEIACFNSPRSLTLSGPVKALDELSQKLQAKNHFARLLQVNFAYHSKYMEDIGELYEQMLQTNVQTRQSEPNGVKMFSSVTGTQWDEATDEFYWVRNMRSPVLFQSAVEAMVGDAEEGPNFLIEIGPSNALAGPISQICGNITGLVEQPTYTSTAVRGSQTLMALYGVAGQVFTSGGSVDLRRVNEYHTTTPSTLIDLPNYPWDHSKKYWQESLASKDWRFRPFARHDLLGSKILGTPWQWPVWRNKLRLNSSPWIGDHRLDDRVVFPGAGYISMAIEAMYQAAAMTVFKGDAPETYRYRMRDIKFLKALVLDDPDDPPEAMLTLKPASLSGGPWHEFRVSAMNKGNWNDHATGFICVETVYQSPKPPTGALLPLTYPIQPKIWYQRMRECGFDFGPVFRKITAMEYEVGQHTGRAKISLELPPCPWEQSVYPLHPVSMDACFQTVISSIWEGDPNRVNAALVPLSIDSLIIAHSTQGFVEGISVARSDYTGIGRTDSVKNYSSSCTVFNADDGRFVLEMNGLRYATLDSPKDATLSHIYCEPKWQPDITLISQNIFKDLAHQFASDPNSYSSDSTLRVAQGFIDLAAHKNPRLKVVEINLDPNNTSSFWLEMADQSISVRKAFSKFTFVSSDAGAVVDMKQRFSAIRHAEFIMNDLKNPESSLAGDFDLAIVTMPESLDEGLENTLRIIHDILTESGTGIFIDRAGILDSVECAAFRSGLSRFWMTHSIALISKEDEKETPRLRDISVVHFTTTNTQQIEDGLRKSARTVTSVFNPSNVVVGSTVVILDEVTVPVMSKLGQRQWSTLQLLVEKKCDILWVTSGAQMSITNPDRALAQGLFRVVRNESPFLKIVTLDVENTSTESTVHAITKCLALIETMESNTAVDNEFTERGGVIYVNRVLTDTLLNKAKEEEAVRGHLETMDIHCSDSTIRLGAAHVGNLDSLQYFETSTGPAPLQDGYVEIAVHASGVNFKDVASAMGIVPENELLLGGEGGGIITRLGPNVTDFNVGQRVAFFKKGSFGNYVQASTQVVHAIPDSMSFEEAATIPCVFMTSMYSLFNLAHMKKGDRVLIHSATGGVGIAAIQLCRYVGAEVYATVGTQEKRDFLKSQYGIPDERIFSSRTTAFAHGISEHTGGKGVNIILNSLPGELLDASWRLIADGGTMVEIGKRDILDRNALSMEPFGRNASFRALDLSHSQITDDMIAELLSDAFALLVEGHIKPIAPVQVFPFSDIPSGLRLMRSGKHIGKLVISRGASENMLVPVRRRPRSAIFREDGCYLIVGGLRGLCSSLATYMAMNNARHLVVMSRSGYEDDISQREISRIRALGCAVYPVQGDVACIEDVQRAFTVSGVPVRGVIQGAMVLCDRIFSSMTLDEYHKVLSAKVEGTWNLHHVSLEQNLDLDFFTPLSSISGLCGTKGQANYAAANTFLDAFASYRQNMGLPACAVDLGVISEVGYMAEREDLKSRYDESVWHAIGERTLRKIFNFSSLQQQQPEWMNERISPQMVTGLQVPQPEHSVLLTDARFLGLFSEGQTNSRESGREGPKDLETIRVMISSNAGAKAILDLTIQILNNYLMRSLRLTEALDFARPLSAYGVDSLAAVELRNFLRIELGVELTTLDVVNAPSLVSMCQTIIAHISKMP